MIIKQTLINYWRFGHVGYMGWGGGFCFHLCKRKRKRCAQRALLEAKTKDEKILHDYTAAINKLLEIWTCWVYGVGWGGFCFHFCKRKRKRCAQCALLKAKKRRQTNEKKRKKLARIMRKTNGNLEKNKGLKLGGWLFLHLACTVGSCDI